MLVGHELPCLEANLPKEKMRKSLIFPSFTVVFTRGISGAIPNRKTLSATSVMP